MLRPAVRKVSLDFETYSESGCVWRPEKKSWGAIDDKKKGIKAVGAEVYAMDPSTRVVCLAYALDDGPTRLWVPNPLNPPDDLVAAVLGGALVYAWNSMFEWLVWNIVCTRDFGWPVLPIEQTRDTMAKALAQGFPAKLKIAGPAVRSIYLKEDIGKDDANLIRFFCVPRNHTAKDKHRFNALHRFPEKAAKFLRYCMFDVATERSIGDVLPELSEHETQVWIADQRINARGVCVDIEAVNACRSYVEQTFVLLERELQHITGGEIQTGNQTAAMVKFLGDRGVHIPNMQADTIKAELKHGGLATKLPPWARRILEIRQLLSLASVKKFKSIAIRTAVDNRVRGLFQYCGAERTGRWAGRGPQPQNLPRGSAKVAMCPNCGEWSGAHVTVCYCGPVPTPTKPKKWCHEASVAAITHIKSRDTLDGLRRRWGDVFALLSSCARAMFIARPGYRLIASDYRAIEAVVLAALAGEEWRLEVFRTHGKIYEMSAAKITGRSLEFYLDYKKQNGEHHPDRQTIGKVAELASGYGGGVGAWKQFGADEFMTDDEIEDAKRKWRAESPNIVRFWYGVERAAMNAVRYPGQRMTYRGIHYLNDGSALRCTLPSGRELVYQSPSIRKTPTSWGELKDTVWFWGMNSNAKAGPINKWMPMNTYGGRLTENIVQAVSRDILAHALVNVERAGYPVVLHIHDEIVCEVPEGFGSVEELERIMGMLPAWAEGWPVIAAGGWAGREYRKD